MFFHDYLSKCYSEIALEGRKGITSSELFKICNIPEDEELRNLLWYHLKSSVSGLTVTKPNKYKICNNTEAKDIKMALKSVDGKTSKKYEDDSSERLFASESVVSRALGISSSMVFDHIELDSLELIARSRGIGITSSQIFHMDPAYAKRFNNKLDRLISLGLVSKRLVASVTKTRVNLIHLCRFMKYIDVNINKIEKELKVKLNRDQKNKIETIENIANHLRMEGKQIMTCADVGRSLGLNKSIAESLRKYIQAETAKGNTLPIKTFIMECVNRTTQATRKLWCFQLYEPVTQTTDSKEVKSGPIMEAGFMRQIYQLIVDAGDRGLTVPDIREKLRCTKTKLIYKCAQAIMKNYPIKVVKVIEGRHSMYRMYAKEQQSLSSSMESSKRTCDEMKKDQDSGNGTQMEASNNSPLTQQCKALNTVSGSKKNKTLKAAAGESVENTTISRRKRIILDLVEKEKIIWLSSITQAISAEEPTHTAICRRTIRKIVRELKNEGKISLINVFLPASESHYGRTILCVMSLKIENEKQVLQDFISRRGRTSTPLACIAAPESDNNDSTKDSDVGKKRNQRSLKWVSQESIKRPRQDQDEQRPVLFDGENLQKSRQLLRDIARQNRYLGFYYGRMTRVRLFHMSIWKLLRQRQQTINIEESRIQFSLKDLLSSFSLRSYLKILGVSTLLTMVDLDIMIKYLKQDINIVDLDPRLSKILRKDEIYRSRWIVSSLKELNLIRPRSSSSNFEIKKNVDFSTIMSYVSHVAKDAIGGEYDFLLSCRIQLEEDKKFSKLPEKVRMCYPDSISQFQDYLPLSFQFSHSKDIESYWEALHHLCCKSGRELNTTVGLDIQTDVPLASAVTPSARIRALLRPLTWCQYSNTMLKQKKYEHLRHEEPFNVLTRIREETLKKGAAKEKKMKKVNAKARIAEQEQEKSSEKKSTKVVLGKREHEDADVGGLRKKLVNRFHHRTNWTEEEDYQLLLSYFRSMLSSFRVLVPPELQLHPDESACKVTGGSQRPRVSWTALGDPIRKSLQDTKNRFTEIEENPWCNWLIDSVMKIYQLRCDSMDRLAHEESLARKNSRMSAAHALSFQVLMQPDDEYYSIAADTALSPFDASEIQHAWRFLWLHGWIVKCSEFRMGKLSRYASKPRANRRGFCLAQAFYEVVRLDAGTYPMTIFSQAADVSKYHQSVRKMNVSDKKSKEELMMELPASLSRGQMVVLLSLHAIGNTRVYNQFESPEKDESNLEKKGFVGHLSGRFGSGDYTAYWQTRIHYHQENKEASQVEAFSKAKWLNKNCLKQKNQALGCNKQFPCTKKSVEFVKDSVLNCIRESNEYGVTMEEILLYLNRIGFQECSNCIKSFILYRLVHRKKATSKDLISLEDSVLSVNGIETQRYVLQSNASIWTIAPYTRSNEKTTTKITFHSQEKVVAYPWIKLDGEINKSIYDGLRRKIVVIVLCAPGIQEEQVYVQLKKSMSLENTRSLLRTLVEENILYVRSIDKVPVSLFSKPVSFVPQRISLSTDHGFINPKETNLYYFPSPTCIQLFGSGVFPTGNLEDN